MKKRGFGVGKWNGFGGKVQPGESTEQAARRELQEEVGIIAHSLEPRGLVHFTFKTETRLWEMHVFAVCDFAGEPVETEEMRPQWFTQDSIPYSHMWQDDPHWLPLFLAGKQFYGRFDFADEATILTHHVEEVEEGALAPVESPKATTG